MEAFPDVADLRTWVLGCVVLLTVFSVRFAVNCRLAGQPLVPWSSPRWLVPWGVAGVLLFVALLLVFSPAVLLMAQAVWPTGDWEADDGEAGERLVSVAAFSVGSAVAMLATLAILVGGRTTVEELGLSLHGLRRHFVTACVAFGLLAVPMYGLQALLSQLWMRSEHPIIEVISEEASPAFLLVMGVSAVLVAPVVEELFFRVLVQGWFENLAVLFQQPAEHQHPELVRRYWWGTPLYPPQGPQPGGTIVDRVAVPMTETHIDRLPVWPIFASSLLFAAAHYGYGPDPIPLFFMACVLGFLYRRTQSAWPCIFLHMLVNGTSMLILWGSVISGDI